MTGCQTLIGRGVLDGLDRLGPVARVVVFDIQPPDSADARIEFHQIDISRPGADAEMAEVMRQERVTTILHAAFLWDAVRDPEWVHELESVGTDYVLAAAVAARIRKLVVTSSAMVYGISHRLPIPVNEDAPLIGERSQSPFRDKAAADRAVTRFAAAHPEVCTTVIRCAIALGKQVDRIVARALRRRVVPTMMGFDPLVQFVHAGDLVEAFIRCLREDHPGVYNVGAPDAIPLSEVLRLGGRSALPLPHMIAIPAARFLWAAGVTDFHPTYLDLLRFALVMDVTRAREGLGFVPRSMRDTVASFYAAEDKT